MELNKIESKHLDEEKSKVAYALNLCAVSISQIIDSKDIVVLKQEREAILNNLNLQHFVKHPALLDIIKRILDTITYMEIQAGDLSFIEKEYQQKLRDAIWSAVPSPGSLFVGTSPATLAIALVSQIGTAYMNYRRNKSSYVLDEEKSKWELKRHELEQLYGLRAQLFETAWKLSADYDFDDNFRLTEKQLSRYSEALLEENPIKRFERLDVMSDRFNAFPPFWYQKGHAAMEVFRDKQYKEFSQEYKTQAIKAYKKFIESHFEFLREDIIAASCFIEYISLLERNDQSIEELLEKALYFAGENYDILQQSVFVNLQLKKLDAVIPSLREMVVNNYNVELNGILLSRIYFERSCRHEYDKLCLIAGKNNVLPWSDDAILAEEKFIATRKEDIIDAYRSMVKGIINRIRINKNYYEHEPMYKDFQKISAYLQKNIKADGGVSEKFNKVEEKLRYAIADPDDGNIAIFSEEVDKLCCALSSDKCTIQIDDSFNIIKKMKTITKN